MSNHASEEEASGSCATQRGLISQRGLALAQQITLTCGTDRMTWKDEDLPALRLLESTVLRLWSGQPEMNDHTVSWAYTTAYQRYRARLRGRDPKPHTLSGLDLVTFTAVEEACEKLLSSGADSVKGAPTGNTDPIPLAKLVEYLRELVRSVERHTKLGGRHGYLEFVQTFIP